MRAGSASRTGREVGQVGVRAAQAIEERQYVFLILIWLVDVYTSVIIRLSFALPVSFLYRLYRVSVERKKIC